MLHGTLKTRPEEGKERDDLVYSAKADLWSVGEKETKRRNIESLGLEMIDVSLYYLHVSLKEERVGIRYVISSSLRI